MLTRVLIQDHVLLAAIASLVLCKELCARLEHTVRKEAPGVQIAKLVHIALLVLQKNMHAYLALSVT